MKYNVFDVVELKNNNKATILNVKDNTYNVEIVNNKGVSLGTKEITVNDIERVIFRK